MRLYSLEYQEHVGQPEEWTLTGLVLHGVNLLVGKNASGKSRILNIIHNLSLAITQQRKVAAGNFHAIFDNAGSPIEYILELHKEKVVREIFIAEGQTLLERGPGGEGCIFAKELDRYIKFQAPDDQLAVAVRRDSIQHSYFEPLHQWAHSLYHYAFGTSMGKDKFALLEEYNNQEIAVNSKDSSRVVEIYHKGKKDFQERFTETIQQDFITIGYPIDAVGIAEPRSISIKRPVPGEFFGMYVKESDLPGNTDQYAMSQGMFRALSIIVQVNYAVLADTPSCILIDDIGEGLDFERSCNLIDVLMAKAQHSAVQLVMATNDRFVMNRVPLEAWSVLDRQGNHITIRNYTNAQDLFDRFKFTGLNNFDFLAFDYLHAGAADA